MGNPTVNPYQGQPLNQNVSDAYNTALGQATSIAGAGGQPFNQAQGYVGQAGGIYGAMSGMTPSDITAGSLAETNLSPYMDPFTQDVINSTIAELDRQEGIQQQGVDDAALDQRAFGGDRMYVQKAAMNDKFDRLRKDTIADLYLKNFTNAQQMGQFDIGNKLAADQANQGMRAGMMTGGAQGFGDLAQLLTGAGIDLSKFGTSALGDLANMGFGWGSDLQKNQLAMGALQQAQNQSILSAIQNQFQSYTGAPMNYLQQYLSSVMSPQGLGTVKSTTSGTGNDIAAIGNIMQGIGAVLPGSYTGGAPASTGSGAK